MMTVFPGWLERARITDGPMASAPGSGPNGIFVVRLNGVDFVIQASNGGGWEHVSVSLYEHPDVTPTWKQMCAIKDLFWHPHETVIQYHPAKADYVNVHPGCLHMWRPLNQSLPKPPTWMLGPVMEK